MTRMRCQALAILEAHSTWAGYPQRWRLISARFDAAQILGPDQDLSGLFVSSALTVGLDLANLGFLPIANLSPFRSARVVSDISKPNAVALLDANRPAGPVEIPLLLATFSDTHSPDWLQAAEKWGSLLVVVFPSNLDPRTSDYEELLDSSVGLVSPLAVRLIEDGAGTH